MRKYERPMLVLEQFLAEQSVADGCTRKTTTVSTVSYAKQTVNCIISESETIFGTANCSGATVVDSATLVWYDEDKDNVRDSNEIYYIWKTTKNGSASNPQTATLNAICAVAGINSDPQTNGGYHVHAGHVAESTNISTNYSFSY